MTIRNISDAKEQLSALLVMVEQGGEVVIARSGKPIARLVRYDASSVPRLLGALKGKVRIAQDFDAPVPECETAFNEGPIEPSA